MSILLALASHSVAVVEALITVEAPVGSVVEGDVVAARPHAVVHRASAGTWATVEQPLT